MDAQMQILQHSLGLNEYGQGSQYRNHFVAGGKDIELCLALISEGFMVQRADNGLCGDSPWFSVTLKGIDHVALNSESPPKKTRRRMRYLRFLEFGDCFDSFLDFCYWDADKSHEWN